MKVSLNWIKKFVKLPADLNPRDLGSRLTLATVEVEKIENAGELLNNVFVGKILSVEPHPNADKLRLVNVDLETEKLQVVCGGINLEIGMLIALAKVGASVKWHGEGEPIVLTPAKIRGVESQGMICASEEIGLGEMFPAKQAGEIVDLTALNLKVGQPLAEALKLDDLIIDIDNKSLTNRPDLWGHYGLARELAAIYDLKLEEYSPKKIKEGKEVDLQVKLEANEFCSRYMGVSLSSVKVGPSPAWLVQSLASVGCRSINNIVDATNYVMYECGQPLHAFDAKKIQDNRIIVRRAEAGEKMTTLDGNEKELTAENLVIADGARAVALAGVMGSADSEIDETTATIILEAATFDPINIRKTAEQHGLRTEASMRFEKSLDPQLPEKALSAVVELVLTLCPEASVTSKVVDEHDKFAEPIKIETSFNFIKGRIGSDDLDEAMMKKILISLGFELKTKGDALTVVVPSWRATKDVSIPEDLVEEVARLHGYDNLTPVMPAVSLDLPRRNELRELEREVKNILVGTCRASEVFNYSYVGKSQLEALRLDNHHYIELINPLSDDHNLLRRDLFVGLFNNIIDNQRFLKDINIFEVGRVFLEEKPGELIRPDGEEVLPEQPLLAAGMLVKVGEAEAFYLAKTLVLELLNQLKVSVKEKLGTSAPAHLHPHRYLELEIDGEVVAQIGEVQPGILMEMDVTERVAYWQINLSKLLTLRNNSVKYTPVAKYPGMERDWAIVVDEKTTWQTIENIIINTAPQLIRSVSLFDIYKSDKIGVDKKSLAFHVFYQSDEATLSSEEVNTWQEKVKNNLEKGVKAVIREE